MVFFLMHIPTWVDLEDISTWILQTCETEMNKLRKGKAVIVGTLVSPEFFPWSHSNGLV